MLDHAPGRQIGQFVIIGRAEQLILDRLLLGDIGGARQQQIAVGDMDRPMGGEKDLLGRAVGDAFFGDGGAAGAQQFDAGFAALVQFCRGRARRGCRNAELCRGGVVHQQEMALLVLNRHAAREHLENVAQDVQFANRLATSCASSDAAVLQVDNGDRLCMHARPCQSLL